MKKTISLLAAGIIFMLPLTASAETMRTKLMDTFSKAEQAYSDLSNGHVNFTAVAFLSEKGAIGGYDDGTFRPEGKINRAELTKMVIAMMLGTPDAEDLAQYKNCFPDVNEEWFAPYVCLAKEQGWIAGYPDNTFKPSQDVSRVEAIKIIINVMVTEGLMPNPTDAELSLPMPADADMEQWYGGYLRFAIVKELLDGEHVTGDENAFYYKPGEPMTRKEVAEMIYRVYVYMLERMEYAEIIADNACFRVNNPDMTDDEIAEQWEKESLTPMGYTMADADNLTATYTEDDVMDDLITDLAKYNCGDKESVDMTKWTWFTYFGA
jgi:hypothetical protein